MQVGEAAAKALFSAHYRPVLPMDPFFGGTGPGEWRPTAPGNPPMAFLYMAFTAPFTMNRPSQFRPPPPPPLPSTRYLREYDEVKAVGADTAHPQPPAQFNPPTTEVAYFWASNFIVMFNEALSDIAEHHLSDIGDSARLLALAGLAAADALIASWDSKVHFNFWRPITAIREGDHDGNARTVGDITWTSLIPSPPYPDHTSAANALGGAFARTLQLFFGTDVFNFSIRTLNPPASNPERHYSRFSDATRELVDARILQGIHFRFSDEAGLIQGSRIAEWAYMRFLRPFPGERRR